jgi:hypothetical protein
MGDGILLPIHGPEIETASERSSILFKYDAPNCHAYSGPSLSSFPMATNSTRRGIDSPVDCEKCNPDPQIFRIAELGTRANR